VLSYACCDCARARSLSLSLFVQPRALAVRVQAVIATRQSLESERVDEVVSRLVGGANGDDDG
jgi:hypothetical protein